MSITRRWPRSPRSPSCAPRSNSNRDRDPIRSPNGSARSAKPATEHSTTWKITLPKLDAAKFDAALQSHRDALIADWKRDHDDDDGRVSRTGRRYPNAVDAFMRLVEAGWDADAARRPHGQHTTVVMHVDVKDRVAALHLGPLLSDDERHYLTLRRHLRSLVPPRRPGHRRRTDHPDDQPPTAPRPRTPPPTCAVPGCGATRGLHAHHIRHWEDGGPTELDNLVLVCPYHHRLHHRGVITITGPAHHLVVTDSDGRRTHRRLTRAPTDHTPTRRAALPRPHRRTRRLVVVRTIPTPTATDKQLGATPRRRRTGGHDGGVDELMVENGDIALRVRSRATARRYCAYRAGRSSAAMAQPGRVPIVARVSSCRARRAWIRGSSVPIEVERYTLKELASDVAAVPAALADEPIVLVGHDWGARSCGTPRSVTPIGCTRSSGRA